MTFNERAKIWRTELGYLPRFMRDFHAQKDLFKTIHESTNFENQEYVKDISWIEGHCYVIDIFLWFMARHGYTLQRVKKRDGVDFDHIHETIARYTHDRREREAEGLKSLFNRSKT